MTAGDTGAFLSMNGTGLRVLRVLCAAGATEPDAAVTVDQDDGRLHPADPDRLDRTLDALVANGFAGAAGHGRYYATAKGERFVVCRDVVREAPDVIASVRGLEAIAADCWSAVPEGSVREAVHAAEKALRNAARAVEFAAQQLAAACEVTR